MLRLGTSAEAPDCSFLMFAKLRPSPISMTDMLEYERELMAPSGADVLRPSAPRIDGVLISSDCALLIEMREATVLQSVQKLAVIFSN